MGGELHCGDNLDVMRRHVASASVDLVYLDPPFNSDRTFLVARGGRRLERAFVDRWSWDGAAQAAFDALTTPEPRRGQGRAGALGEAMLALKASLGERLDLLAYLSMMAVRLVEVRRVLRDSGAVYLHCDPTASHYLKIVLDVVFGANAFRNEIIWRRSQPKGHATTRFPRSHDVLFFYARSAEAKLRRQYARHDPAYVAKFYRHVEDGTGRRYQLGDATNPNKDRPNLTYEFPPGSGTVRVWRWTKDRMLRAHRRGEIVVPKGGAIPRVKRYLDAMPGSPVTDLWLDIEHVHGADDESTGYPTQKPERLLRRIIEASSDVGDVVLDPFCGCGTTLLAAEALGRRWIGIDVAPSAIELVRARLAHPSDERPQTRRRKRA